MKLLIFSDVHGNLPALQAMLKNSPTVDGYICLGDSINYGPWSNECVDVISSLSNVTYIRGNHEEYFLDGVYPGDNLIAKTFFDFCYPRFDRFDKISNLIESVVISGFTFSHTTNNAYIYPDSDITLKQNTVIGHSHHQFEINQFPFKLYNPGSVGQNRKYINVINYSVFDTDFMNFEGYAIIYDVEVVLDKMRQEKYPQICIDYYDKKERLVI